MTARVLNPNVLAQKYFRRLYNIAAGVFFKLPGIIILCLYVLGTAVCHEIKFYNSLSQLENEVASGVLDCPALESSCKSKSYKFSCEIAQVHHSDSLEKDQEKNEVFSPVMMAPFGEKKGQDKSQTSSHGTPICTPTPTAFSISSTHVRITSVSIFPANLATWTEKSAAQSFTNISRPVVPYNGGDFTGGYQ